MTLRLPILAALALPPLGVRAQTYTATYTPSNASEKSELYRFISRSLSSAGSTTLSRAVASGNMQHYLMFTGTGHVQILFPAFPRPWCYASPSSWSWYCPYLASAHRHILLLTRLRMPRNNPNRDRRAQTSAGPGLTRHRCVRTPTVRSTLPLYPFSRNVLMGPHIQ